MNSIDAVISWVDGYDPAYQQKLTSFCEQQGIEKNVAVEPTRTHQSNEIHYCLHALRRFAPWIRTIYIVTNQQIPPTVSALQGTPFGQKIKIIDPCCGSGTFTITLLEQLEKYKINKVEALKNNVFFYDVDKISVLTTLINLFEYFKRDNIIMS